ncbi:hypothetical protein TWF730_000200 [Orbilia blumenaviensis]|uniref:Uncharacterized protein n=1 Tax=Orbilia blumenaviensis TaxID=1796055 RepID=A0AAV9VRZ1_9PEZI
MSHLPYQFTPSARAPRPASTFSKSIQDHTTKYRLRKLPSGTFKKEKIPRSERPQKARVPPVQRMQGVRRDTADIQIRRVKWWAIKRISKLTHKEHKAIRRSQALRQKLLHAKDEAVDVLVPLFEELGTEPSAVLKAQKLAKKLDKKLDKIEKNINQVERRIGKIQRDIAKVERTREAKIASYELHIRNLTRKTAVGVEGLADSEDIDEKAAESIRKAAELWLHTRLNRHTRSCTSFDRPLHRSKGHRRVSAEGIRVRWSGDLSVGDSVIIRPTESGASGEISRSTSGDSLASSIVNIDTIFALPAKAITEGLELDLKVVRRGAQQRQFDPQEAATEREDNEGDAKVDEKDVELEEIESETESRAKESGSGTSNEESEEESTTKPEPKLEKSLGKGKKGPAKDLGTNPKRGIKKSSKSLKEPELPRTQEKVRNPFWKKSLGILKGDSEERPKEDPSTSKKDRKRNPKASKKGPGGSRLPEGGLTKGIQKDQGKSKKDPKGFKKDSKKNLKDSRKSPKEKLKDSQLSKKNPKGSSQKDIKTKGSKKDLKNSKEGLDKDLKRNNKKDSKKDLEKNSKDSKKNLKGTSNSNDSKKASKDLRKDSRSPRGKAPQGRLQEKSKDKPPKPQKKELAKKKKKDDNRLLPLSWSIRIEAPKPHPPPPKSTASKVAHWAGIPHYRLPRFNLADEAMLQELQTDELDEEDYALLPTSSSTAGKARHEVQLVNVPGNQGFLDQAPKPKKSGGRLRRLKASFKSKSKQAPRLNEDSGDEEEIPRGAHVDQTVPPDFDSNSADYPRHPRTPDRYMLPMSRGSSGRERRSSMSSMGDRIESRPFSDPVKAPVALRKSPPQLLQAWDDDNPYIYNYTNRAHDNDYPYPPRPRPMNRTMSIASSSRLPILHESRHEASTDDYSASRVHPMHSTSQKSPLDDQFRQRRGSQNQVTVSPQDSPQGRGTSVPSIVASQQTSDEAALTEMSTEIQIGGERTEKRTHPQPMHTIEEWVQRIGTPPELGGTPKTIPSDDVEVDQVPLLVTKTAADEVFQASPMREEIENPEIPIPVPTEQLPEAVATPSRAGPIIAERRNENSPSPEIGHIEIISPSYKWPTVEELLAVTSPPKQSSVETQISTPITVVRIPPAEGAQPSSSPIKALLPSPTPSEELTPPTPSPLDSSSPLPIIAPLRFLPRTTTLRSGSEGRHSPLSGPATTFALDPKAAEKRRMTVAFGITPLQRRETAELAQDVLRRVSTTAIGGQGRRGSLVSVIRVVDVLLVKEREEQLKLMRRAEMAWD